MALLQVGEVTTWLYAVCARLGEEGEGSTTLSDRVIILAVDGEVRHLSPLTLDGELPVDFPVQIGDRIEESNLIVQMWEPDSYPHISAEPLRSAISMVRMTQEPVRELFYNKILEVLGLN